MVQLKGRLLIFETFFMFVLFLFLMNFRNISLVLILIGSPLDCEPFTWSYSHKDKKIPKIGLLHSVSRSTSLRFGVHPFWSEDPDFLVSRHTSPDVHRVVSCFIYFT